MKTLGEIIADFEGKEVIGEGDVFTGNGILVSDFYTGYAPADGSKPIRYNHKNGVTLYEIGMDSNYLPISLNVTKNRLHDLSSKLNLMKDAVNMMLFGDPRWVYKNYNSKISKVNNNLYTVEVDRKSSGINMLPEIAIVVELHVSDDDVLKKTRIVTLAVQKNSQKELGTEEINFVYP